MGPLDYSDKRFWVHFEVADKKDAFKSIMNLDFLAANIIFTEYGFNLFICNQHIPEVIRQLLKDNHAVYQVIILETAPAT